MEEVTVFVHGEARQANIIAKNERYIVAYVPNKYHKHNLVVAKKTPEGYFCRQIGNDNCLNWMLRRWPDGFRAAFDYLDSLGKRIIISVNK